MSFILALMVSLSALMGTPSQPLMDAPSQASTQAPECEEDMDCWDCATMGNHECGDTHTGDAWATVDAAHITAPASQGGMMLTYVGWTNEALKVPTAGYFTLQSNTDSRVWYVYRWETLTKA